MTLWMILSHLPVSPAKVAANNLKKSTGTHKICNMNTFKHGITESYEQEKNKNEEAICGYIHGL